MIPSEIFLNGERALHIIYRRSCTEEVPRVRGAPSRSCIPRAFMIWTTNIELIYTVRCGVIMASIKVNVCRFCSTVLPKRSVVLFSKEGLEKDLPGRVSRVVELPVSREDGLSPHSCMPCMRKFQAAEVFRSLHRSSYEKQGYSTHPHSISYTLMGHMALERG